MTNVMNKLNYTPGPWYATGWHVQSSAINGDNYVCRAEGDDDQQAEDNAKLIAAAPDLYAELRRVQVELMGWEESDQVSFGIAADMLTRLRSIQSILNKVTL